MMMSSRMTEEALGGLAAGILGTLIGFPLDLIKTRMQTSQQHHRSGILSTGRSILQTEGILKMYKGVIPPLISLTILNTFTFTAYSYFQERYQAQRGWDWRNGWAGATCGPFSATVSTVENLLKTQLQVDTAHRFRGTRDCVMQLTRQHGVGVIYSGHGINTLREMTFLQTYFFVYEGLRQELMSRASGDTSTWAIPVAGGFSGAIAWTVSFPLDCVRAGVQGRSDLGKPLRAMDVFRDLIRRKGVRGLFSGVSPSIARAFLVSSSRFSAYEMVLWMLRGGRDAGLDLTL